MPVSPQESAPLLKSQNRRAREPLMAGNWKMYKTLSEAQSLIGELVSLVAGVSDREILVCPPFPCLGMAAERIRGTHLKLGAQNLHWEAEGAFTGEVSGPMLKAAGCSYVIIGHSERRQYFGETDASVQKKMKAAFKHGLLPIVCVGETLQEREAGSTFQVVERQVRQGLAGLATEEIAKIVIAYEPVWAIGTGKTATPAQAQEVHAFIRKIYGGIYGPEAAAQARVLYGGSVKPDNIDALMNEPDIDGGLVGGASLKAPDFARIVKFQKP